MTFDIRKGWFDNCKNVYVVEKEIKRRQRIFDALRLACYSMFNGGVNLPENVQLELALLIGKSSYQIERLRSFKKTFDKSENKYFYDLYEKEHRNEYGEHYYAWGRVHWGTKSVQEKLIENFINQRKGHEIQ